MPDRDKVIGHLNDCMEASRRENTWVFVRKDIVADAITLLEEQESKLVVVNGGPVFCPTCGNELLLLSRQRFCDECGQELKWE